MTYAMNRFQPRAELSLVEAVEKGAKLGLLSGKLYNMVRMKKEKSEAQKRAEVLTLELVKRLEARTEDEDEEPDVTSPLRKFIWKALKWGAKKIFKYVVRPILRFAARVAMNLVRTVVTAVVDYVIVPIIEFVMAFALANPITAGLLALLAVGGGAYYLWSKFFKEQAPEHDVDTRGSAEPIASTEVPSVESEALPVTATTPVKTENKPSVTSTVATPSISDYVQEPVATLKKQYKKLVNRFTGFGDDEDAYIKEASKMFSIPEDILRGFIKMEAGWNGAMSPTGAIGAGQFIQSTWDGLARTPQGRAIGMTVIGNRFRKDDDPRRDKRINTLATALLARNNAALLKKAGLPLTGENLYMMHNIGPSIIDVMLGRPASAATLKAMKQNGMLPNQSAAQFLEYQKGRYDTAYNAVNDSTLPSTTIQYKEGISVAQNAPVKTHQSAPPQASGGAAMDDNSQDKTLIHGPGKTLIGVS